MRTEGRVVRAERTKVSQLSVFICNRNINKAGCGGDTCNHN
jgi:hypothetical protein